MFSMGPGELIIIMIVALVIVGPEKLPELARTIARGLRDLKRYAQDMRSEIEKDVMTDDIKRDFDEIVHDRPRDYSYPTPVTDRETYSYPYEDEEKPDADQSEEAAEEAEDTTTAADEEEESRPATEEELPDDERPSAS